jgi:PAS domain-containing protein
MTPQAMLDNMADAILVVDHNNRVTQANKAAVQLIALPQPAIIGQLVTQLPLLGPYCQTESDIPLFINDDWYIVGMAKSIEANSDDIRNHKVLTQAMGLLDLDVVTAGMG